jgi:hypothetical protein
MKYFFSLLTALSLLLQGSCPSNTLSIQNPSFEQVSGSPHATSCGAEYYPVPGWSGQIHALQLSNPNPCYIAVPPPDGQTVGYAGYGGSFSQTLMATPAQFQDFVHGGPAEGVYTLTFWVANYFPHYPGQYDVEVSFGTQQLCESYGWGTGAFTKVTMICPASQHLVSGNSEPGGGPAQGSNPFVITFTVNGWILLFDNVSMTFTPQ